LIVNFRKFAEDPYLFVDQLDLTFKGQNFNLFQKYVKIQKMALWGALICLVCWIGFGFDSTPLQFVHVLYEGVPALIQGTASFGDVHAIYNLYYGKEMHYSAFVIYWLLYYAISKSWEKAGVVKSKNIVFSSAVMLLSIGVFEFFWIFSFSTFQNQPWVSTWRWPQMRILFQNLIFTLAGGVTILYMLTERWHWKGREQLDRAYYFRLKTWVPWILLAASIIGAFLWILNPSNIFNAQLLTVELETEEIWRSSTMFPQTLYTIDLDPTDGVNAGVWFWIASDLIHAVNTGVKVLWAITTYYIFRVRRAE